MTIEIGEAREAWGLDVLKKVEDIASQTAASERPFYIVYACKEDRPQSEHVGKAVFKQSFTLYREKPPLILGILTWKVDETGDLHFVPESSAPFDVPLDESLLSDKATDSFGSIAQKAENLNVLLS